VITFDDDIGVRALRDGGGCGEEASRQQKPPGH
jgi:hypothetical protein